jgi:predicted DNA-binding transcriptional regulator AlpA
MNDNVTSSRLMTRAEAAAFCAISPSRFSQWVSEGRIPSALQGTNRWDREAIKRYLDLKSGLTNDNTVSAGGSAFAAWKNSRDKRP